MSSLFPLIVNGCMEVCCYVLPYSKWSWVHIDLLHMWCVLVIVTVFFPFIPLLNRCVWVCFFLFFFFYPLPPFFFWYVLFFQFFLRYSRSFFLNSSLGCVFSSLVDKFFLLFKTIYFFNHHWTSLVVIKKTDFYWVFSFSLVMWSPLTRQSVPHEKYFCLLIVPLFTL